MTGSYVIYTTNMTVYPTFYNISVHNSTNSTPVFSSDKNEFILPIWRQILWSVLYLSMVIVATGGNLIVIWIVLAHKRMRTVTNYFLLNLSVADTMVSTLNVTFNYIYMLNSHWPFGNSYCKIAQFIAVLSICASVFSLMAISVDRYMAIMTPLKPRMGRMATVLVAVSTWVLGIVISCPQLVFYTTYEETFSDGEKRIVCYGEWPDGDTINSFHEYIYNVFFTVITYVIPIASMTFTYARIGVELWGSKSIGESTQRQIENIKSKRRVVKMMVVVVIIFAVCWLPFHLYFIVTSYHPEITSSPYIQETYLAIYWLAMSNSMYNPIIYCWMNARFRAGFVQFFSCLPFVHSNHRNISRREMYNARSFSASPEGHRIARNNTVQISIHAGCSTPPTANTYFNGEENCLTRTRVRKSMELKLS